MLDFEQLAFIEKWRQKASRGVVVALDGTRGDVIVTMRVGEGPARLDMRGQDATGAIRKQRLAIGDRITVAIEYSAKDVKRSDRDPSVSGGLVGPAATVEGTVTVTGETAVVECGPTQILVRGDTLGSVTEGDRIAFVIAGEGKAYYIPTRG